MKTYKHNKIAQVLKQRIHAGDYALMGLPSERTLAQSLGVSYLTARKAVQELIDQGVMFRNDQGRAQINTEQSSSLTRFAFLAPAFRSASIEMHRQAIIQTGRELGVTVRPLEYAHWDDPIIFDALHGFDGIFFYVSTGQMPKTLIRQMSEAPCKLAVFDKDLSEQGIVSIQLCQDRDFFNLYESLRTNGYTQFDCVNCQSHDEEIDRRISSWGCWRDKHGLPGDLHDLPTAPWQDSVPNGYRVFSQLLAGDVNPDTAYICTTYAAVQGALRVAYERNLKPGVDFGLACYQSMTNPRYLCPTITSLEMPMIHHICLKIFNWFLHQGDSNWAGSLRLYPDDRMVFQGESTAHQACVTTT